MAKGLTPKQEAFCLAYVETGNASEAYRQAYNAENMSDAVIHNKASDLLKKGEVRVRVEELQAEHRQRHNVTIDSLTWEFEMARLKAMESDNGASSAVAATLGKARLHGLLLDRTLNANVDVTHEEALEMLK